MRRALGRRYWLLWAGLTISALGLLLGLTPWAYEVERQLWGVPDEHYPELLWLSMAAFIGIPLTIAGSAVVISSRNRRHPHPASPRERGEEQD